MVSVQMTPIVKENSGSQGFFNLEIVYYNIYFELQVFYQNNMQHFISKYFRVLINLKKRWSNAEIKRLGFLKPTYLYQSGS